MAKSTKIIAALGVVAGLGVAAMPLASYATETTSIVDNISVQIDPVCGFKSNDYATAGTGETAWGTASGEIDSVASVSNSWAITLENGGDETSPKHTINAVCNNSNGFSISATNTADLTNEKNDKIGYGQTVGEGKVGYYYASIAFATDADGGATMQNVTDGVMNDMSAAAEGANKVIVKGTPTSGTTFEVTYTIGTEDTTPAGTYTGSVTYSLAATPAS